MLDFILRRGDRGPYVAMLQKALVRAGEVPGSLDGIFGPRTERAVRAFQASNSLRVDGIVGKNTWAALRPYLVGYVVHTIVRGDTFYRLARTYGTTAAAIQTANPLAEPRRLRIGQKLIIPLGFEVTAGDIPYTSLLSGLIAEGLARRYPFITLSDIGISELGRPIQSLVMGEGDTEVMYNASHHANEWITTPLLLRYLERYAAAYAGGRRIAGVDASRLFSLTTLFIVPMVNPDGVDLVTGALGGEALANARRIAAAYPAIPFPGGWKANILGTDLNLNYPAGWEQAKEIKYAQGFTSPAPRDFVGTAPLSARETQTMYAFTRAHDFALTISYHTQGRVIYWKYLDQAPPRGYAIALDMSAASGYAVETVPYNSAFAGYKDWFIDEYNRPGYTIEAGRGVNPLPISDLPEIYAENEGILTLGMSSLI